MKKMTKREMFTEVMAVVETTELSNKAEMLEFLAHEIELLEKKSSKSGQTKTQKENEILKAEIIETLANFEMPITISEFQVATKFAPPEYSNQKISALMNQLVKEGKVVKTIEKRKSYFSVV